MKDVSTGIQVKYSKDFRSGADAFYLKGFAATSWFTLPSLEKIENNNADVWVFAIYSFEGKNLFCIVLEPAELVKRLKKMPGKGKFYLYITADGKHCFAAQGLKKPELERLTKGDYSGLSAEQDFTRFLGNWAPVARRVGL